MTEGRTDRIALAITVVCITITRSTIIEVAVDWQEPLVLQR